MNEKRLFKPRITDDLVERAERWIGKIVTVESWHDNVAMKLNYPEDKIVGYVLEFHADIPESELLEVEELLHTIHSNGECVADYAEIYHRTNENEEWKNILGVV